MGVTSDETIRRYGGRERRTIVLPSGQQEYRKLGRRRPTITLRVPVMSSVTAMDARTAFVLHQASLAACRRSRSSMDVATMMAMGPISERKTRDHVGTVES